MKAFHARLVSLVLSSQFSFAQSGPVTFDVVSVKANKTGSGHHEIGWSERTMDNDQCPSSWIDLAAYHSRTDELIRRGVGDCGRLT